MDRFQSRHRASHSSAEPSTGSECPQPLRECSRAASLPNCWQARGTFCWGASCCRCSARAGDDTDLHLRVRPNACAGMRRSTACVCWQQALPLHLTLHCLLSLMLSEARRPLGTPASSHVLAALPLFCIYRAVSVASRPWDPVDCRSEASSVVSDCCVCNRRPCSNPVFVAAQAQLACRMAYPRLLEGERLRWKLQKTPVEWTMNCRRFSDARVVPRLRCPPCDCHCACHEASQCIPRSCHLAARLNELFWDTSGDGFAARLTARLRDHVV